MTATVAKPRTGPTEERLALAARCRQLRDRGLLQREIAGELGLHRNWVSELLCDPDGSKARARKDRYQGVCIECGGPTTGSEGAGEKRPARCQPCQHRYQHEGRHWTPEQIIATFREFYERVGRVPTVVDIMFSSRSIASKLSAERIAEAEEAFALVRLPHPWSVSREFGSWAAGVTAAGLEPAPSGGAGHRGTRRPRTRTQRAGTSRPQATNQALFDELDRLLQDFAE